MPLAGSEISPQIIVVADAKQVGADASATRDWFRQMFGHPSIAAPLLAFRGWDTLSCDGECISAHPSDVGIAASPYPILAVVAPRSERLQIRKH